MRRLESGIFFGLVVLGFGIMFLPTWFFDKDVEFSFVLFNLFHR